MLLTGEEIEYLIEGCKKNNRRAQEQLYRAFRQPMSAICLRYTKNAQDVTAVLNNGFLKIFLKINQYDASKGALATWMRRIMIHESIDFLRKQSAFNVEKSSLTDDIAIESDVLNRMNAEALLALVRQLPAATQLVFNLFIVEGYNHGEIAVMLNISQGTSRWHLSEARKQLKKSVMVPERKNG